MHTCKKLAYLFAGLLMVCFTGTAYAAFEITASTDVQTIPAIECDQAGSYTMTAATGLQLREGDVITYNLTSTGGDVTLCKAVDYFLALTNDGTLNLTADNSYPVYSTVATDDIYCKYDDGTYMNDDGSQLIFGFHVSGSKGATSLTLTPRCLDPGISTGTELRAYPTTNRVIMTYTAAVTSKLTIALWDEKFNTPRLGVVGSDDDTVGFLKKNSTSTTTSQQDDYTVSIDSEDNTLCINTSAITGSSVFVEASPMSSPTETQYKLNFTGTYRIALVSGSLTYTAAAIGKSSCLPFSIAPSVDQLGNSYGQPESFSPGIFTDGTGWTSAAPVCSSQSYGRGIITTKATSMVAGDKYRVTLTVLSMPSGGTSYSSTSKAWFKTTGSAVDKTYWTLANNARNSSKTSAGFSPVDASATYSSIGSSGEFTVDPPKASEANYTGYHTVRSGWLTVSANVGESKNTLPDSLMIDIGTIYFDYNNLTEGDSIGVQIQVEKYPCGSVVTETICVGTVQSAACSTSGCRLYCSYLTNAANTSYWSGLAITNLSSTAEAPVTITLYDTNGGTASKTYTLAANAIEVMVLNSSWLSAADSNSIDTSLNMRAYITSSTTPVEAQIMIGGSDASAGIYGYFPRNSCFEDAVGDWATGL